MDGRTREPGHSYVYGSAGGTLVAYDDPPEQAEPVEARRAKRLERALTKLVRDRAKQLKRLRR